MPHWPLWPPLSAVSTLPLRLGRPCHPSLYCHQRGVCCRPALLSITVELSLRCPCRCACAIPCHPSPSRSRHAIPCRQGAIAPSMSHRAVHCRRHHCHCIFRCCCHCTDHRRRTVHCRCRHIADAPSIAIAVVPTIATIAVTVAIVSFIALAVVTVLSPSRIPSPLPLH